MSRSIAAMHVAKKELGLDDETYRATLAQVTGKTSSSAMTEPERQKVLEHFRGRGFKGGSKGSRKRLEGAYAGKLQALWIAGYNLGLVRDRDDRALLAFVKRQTGLDHVRFLRHAQDATKAIEGLKGWLERSGGVDWNAHDDPADCVLAAQICQLRAASEGNAALLQLQSGAPTSVLGVDIASLGTLTAGDKHVLMNSLGELIRKLKGPK